MQQKNMIIWCMLTHIWSACTDIFFLSFQAIFCFFTPLLTPQINKLKFGKTVKKHLDILSFYRCVPLIKIIWCMVPEIWSSTDRIFWSSYTLKNENIKNEKTPGDIIILHKCTKNHDHPLYTVPEIWHMADVIVIFILGYQTFFQALFYHR